jgi:hypothetical protein
MNDAEPARGGVNAALPLVWAIAVTGAALLTLTSGLLGGLPPWSVAIPISIGAVLGLIFCIRTAAAWKDFEDDEILLKPFSSDFWLRLRTEKNRNSPDQLDFFEQTVPEAGERRKVCRMVTDEGTIYLVSSERFHELLVSKVTDDLDRAAEHALAVAWRRIPTQMQPEIRLILNNLVRDIIINDLRGSVLRLLANTGHDVIKELEQIAEKADEQPVPFKLEPVGPKMRAKRKG